MKNVYVNLGLMILASLGANAVAKPACSPGTLPRFVCAAIPSDDGIYTQLEFDITVCQGKDLIELVSVNPDGKREALQATLKDSSKAWIYTGLDDQDPSIEVFKLTINKLVPTSSRLKIVGDSLYQGRVCRQVR